MFKAKEIYVRNQWPLFLALLSIDAKSRTGSKTDTHEHVPRYLLCRLVLTATGEILIPIFNSGLYGTYIFKNRNLRGDFFEVGM